ncbi:MAG: 50S ribosomal protein L4 [candidate division Zixibacteria bacterium]|nr:50S ribosomal protein L4 [candidate division Zixibacteria bacterium]
MNKADLFNIEGKKTGELELKPELFGIKPNANAVHQYVKIYLSNQRQGTVEKKNRSEVRGGGVKPWRQKGTGRARAGSTTSPIWVGGGRTFGPYKRNWKTTLPGKISKLALKSTFSSKASEERIKILENINLEKPSSKTIARLLRSLGLSSSKILLLGVNREDNLYKSSRNIANLRFKPAAVVNPYDILNCEYLLMTSSALKKLEEVFSS